VSKARYLIGDTRGITATLDDDSVDLVLTSPPFLALRSYLPDGHEHKHAEIGGEGTPAAFIDVLLGLAAEWRRVLAPHGSIAIELGDTYSSSGGTTDNRETTNGGNDLAPRGARGGGTGWPLAKSLALVPELFRIGLAYGINPLTGQESPAGKWRVRNVVRWVRPNPPVGALGDKYRPATTDMVIACVSDKRWFDLDAVRTTSATQDRKMWQSGGSDNGDNLVSHAGHFGQNPAGAPPLDTWTIPTHPFKGAHYATWPPELCRIPIESMCPRHVCNVCGQPRRRITETTRVVSGPADKHKGPDLETTPGDGGPFSARGISTTETLGWSDCGHNNNWRPGIVLDPFAGSGTTLAVATGHARDAIGIDLDPRNAELAEQRVGMFVTIEKPEKPLKDPDSVPIVEA